MRRGIILELHPRNGFDFARIVEDYANGKPVDLSACDLQQINSIVDSFRDEFIEYIGKYGLAALMTRESLTEALVSPGTGTSDVQTLLQTFLCGLSITTDLVIVDPYFFASTKDTSYPQLVKQVLQPVLPTLRNLTVITLPEKVDGTLVEDITNALAASAPRLSLVRKPSRVFHDRFWIDPISSKGFICGTSLNGLGKKYALVDHLEASDAADVVNALKSQHLL